MAEAKQSKYNAFWGADTSDLAIEMACIRRGGQWRIGDRVCGEGLVHHFSAMRKLLWPHLDDHRWNQLCLEETVKSKVTCLLGPGSCVAGDTRILNPVTGEQPTIRELYEKNINPIVQTLEGPAIAGVPFIKGCEELYEVVLGNGRRFKATAGHRVLTSKAFERVSQLQIGSLLYGYAPSHRQSISESFPSIHEQDAPCFPRKVEGFQDDYPACFCYDDEQLHSAKDTCQSSSPSLNGVPKHRENASCALDDLEQGCLYSHSYQLSFHPSMRNGIRPLRMLEIPSSLRVPSRNASPCVYSYEQLWQSRKTRNPHRTFVKPNPYFENTYLCDECVFSHALSLISSKNTERNALEHSSILKSQQCLKSPGTTSKSVCVAPCAYPNNESCALKVSLSPVVSITRTKKEDYFDLVVPEIHHYFAEGAIHHNSGKTHFAAWYSLCDYYVHPDDTCVLISSTTLPGLELRVWGEIKTLHSLAQERYDVPGNMIESKHAISTDEIGEEEIRDLRKGIIGIPCIQNGRFVGLGRYHGIKQKRMRLVADEASLMSANFLNAFANLDKNVDFRALVLGNPNDIMDPLGKAAEPKDGWGSHMEPEKTSVWDTRFMGGRAVNLIGTDSPNFDDPEGTPARFPYLISREKIANTLSFFSQDSSEYYSQCIGSMKIGQMLKRVLTRDLCKKFLAFSRDVVWDGPTTKIGGLDAAYGGDRCITGHVEFGKTLDGVIRILLHAPVIVPMRVGTGQDPEDQISVFVKDYCKRMNVPPENFFHDSTGRGSLGTSLARIWSNQCNPVEFGGSPTNRPVSLDLWIWDEKERRRRMKRCDEHYSKFVTELWYTVRYAVEAGQVRGMPEDVLDEFCQREWRKTKGDKIEVETKVEMKERTGRSPDCFVSGTSISTMKGERPIEALQLGDEILTPFGPSPIVAIHQSNCNELTEVKFSNGERLRGKGTHKVFTWDSGWIELSNLSIDNETESVKSLPVWNILNAFFTKTGNTGFKAMVDTMQMERMGKLNVSDFYTELSGLTTLDVFLKVCASIIWMVIGRTTKYPIWNFNQFRNTLPIIAETIGLNLKPNEKCSPDWLRQSSMLRRGIIQKLENIFILKTAKINGNTTEIKRRQRAPSAVQHSSSISQEVDGTSVPFHVPKNMLEKEISMIQGHALFATLFSWLTNMAKRKPVPITAQQFFHTETESLYNLTLAEHNAYYANGILVQNCADWCSVCFEGARRRGFQISRLASAEAVQESRDWLRDLADEANTHREHELVYR